MSRINYPPWLWNDVDELLRDGPLGLRAMDIAVRAATVEDLQPVLALLGQLNADDPTLTTAEAQDTWHRMLGQSWRRVLVAVDGDLVVGSADCMVIANLTRRARPYMVIENVVVDVDYRRAKVGTVVLRAAVDLAREEGCYKAQLLADDTPAMHGFYESCGFEPAAQGFKQRL